MEVEHSTLFKWVASLFLPAVMIMLEALGEYPLSLGEQIGCQDREYIRTNSAWRIGGNLQYVSSDIDLHSVCVGSHPQPIYRAGFPN